MREILKKFSEWLFFKTADINDKFYILSGRSEYYKLRKRIENKLEKQLKKCNYDGKINR